MNTDKKTIIIPDFMIFLKSIEKYPKIILTDLHLQTQITYCHLHSIKKVSMEEGWVTITHDGLKQKIELSEKGKEMISHINSLLNIMGIRDDELLTYRRKSKLKKMLEPVEKEPVEKEPVEKEPVEQEPVEQEPVEQEPVEKEPVEKEPVEKEPVEKEPVEKELTVNDFTNNDIEEPEQDDEVDNDLDKPSSEPTTTQSFTGIKLDEDKENVDSN